MVSFFRGVLGQQVEELVERVAEDQGRACTQQQRPLGFDLAFSACAIATLTLISTDHI